MLRFDLALLPNHKNRPILQWGGFSPLLAWATFLMKGGRLFLGLAIAAVAIAAAARHGQAQRQGLNDLAAGNCALP